MSVNLTQLREATAEEMQEYRAAVTPIGTPRVQSTYYDFTTEDEAQMFAQWCKEDLAQQEFFDYVDHDVYQEVVGWAVRVDFIDRTPPADEAA